MTLAEIVVWGYVVIALTLAAAVFAWLRRDLGGSRLRTALAAVVVGMVWPYVVYVALSGTATGVVLGWGR